MRMKHTKCEQRGAAQVLHMLCESGTVVDLIYLATLENPPVAPADEHFLSNPCKRLRVSTNTKQEHNNIENWHALKTVMRVGTCTMLGHESNISLHKWTKSINICILHINSLTTTFEVPVINCKRRAMSSLLNDRTTSQNHWTTCDAAVYPVYSVLAFKSSTVNQHTIYKNTLLIMRFVPIRGQSRN